VETDLAERIVAEGIKFVVAGGSNPSHAMAPSRVVDEGWHALILHTQLYADLPRPQDHWERAASLEYRGAGPGGSGLAGGRI